MSTFLGSIGKFGLATVALVLGGTVVYGVATEGWGSILVLIALVISLVKQLIAFIGFLTFAIKALVVLAFIAVFLAVGFAILRSYNKRRAVKD